MIFHRKELTRAALSLLCFKMVYFITLTAALLLWGGDLTNFVRLPQRWIPNGGPCFASHFTGWDAGYYLFLSDKGYKSGDSACAFNPLWPFLVRWSSVFAGGSHLVGGIVLANVLSMAGFLLFFDVAAMRFGASAAKLGLVFLLAFPGSLFFQFIYSEPLFFFLVMLLWWGLDRRRYPVAAAAAFLLPLSRSVGVFALLPIGWQVLEPLGQWLSNRASLMIGNLTKGRRVAHSNAFQGLDVSNNLQHDHLSSECEHNDTNQAGKTSPPAPFILWFSGRPAWLLAAPLAGWGVYLALMGFWTGNPFEGLEAQKYWHVHSVWNLINLPKFVLGLIVPTAWHAFTGSLLDRCVFMLVIYILPVIWRLGRDMVAWTLMLALVPAMSGTFTSFTRFASCAFPVFIGLGVFFSKAERRASRYSLLAAFAILQAVLVWRYTSCWWAG
jgi:hypothetical protein